MVGRAIVIVASLAKLGVPAMTDDELIAEAHKWVRGERCWYIGPDRTTSLVLDLADRLSQLVGDKDEPKLPSREELSEAIANVGEYIPGSHGEDYINPNLAADAVLALISWRNIPEPQPAKISESSHVNLAINYLRLNKSQRANAVKSIGIEWHPDDAYVLGRVAQAGKLDELDAAVRNLLGRGVVSRTPETQGDENAR